MSLVPELPAIDHEAFFCCANLKEIRIDLELRDEVFADSIFERFKDLMLPLSVDCMGNIIVQKLVERGTAGRRLSILLSLSPWLATLSCHKNGTWVVQKFIALACHNCWSSELKQLVMDSLKPYLVSLLKDQFGNYVVQGLLGLGHPFAAPMLDCLVFRTVEVAKSRFGARAMKSLLEPASSRQYDAKYYKEIVKGIILESLDLSQNPHGALLVSYLISIQQYPADEACKNLCIPHTTLFLNRHLVGVLEHLLPAQADHILEQMANCDLQRLLADQGAAGFMAKVVEHVAGGGGGARLDHLKKRLTRSMFDKIPVHSELHAECLAKLKKGVWM